MIRFIQCLGLSIMVFVLASNADASAMFNIVGKIDTLLLNDPLDVLLVKTVRPYAHPNWIGYTDDHQLAIDADGSFFKEITPPGDLFYMAVSVRHRSGKITYLGSDINRERFLLASAGDSITIHIEKDQRIRFSGPGSDKLTLQESMNSLQTMPSEAREIVNRIFNKDSYKSYCEGFIQAIENTLRLKLDLLKLYQPRLSAAVYNRLYIDCIGEHYGAIYKYMVNSIYMKGHEAVITKKVVNNWAENIGVQDDASITKSPYYMTFLLAKLRFQHVFNSKEKINNEKTGTVAALMNAINIGYTGEMKDALKVYALLSYTSMDSQALENIDEPLKDITDPNMQDILNVWKIYNESGRPAYAFKLPDPNGKIHRLEDYRGKFLVLDFWFNGCFGCRYMQPKIKDLMNHYKGRSDVLFLSINVDKGEDKWKKGLESGLYTVPNQVELSTMNTNRDEHPFLKAYNIRSYPRLMIIDDHGHIVSANPPDPRIDDGVGFRQLLDKVMQR